MIQINCDVPHDMAVNVRNNIINYYYVLLFIIIFYRKRQIYIKITFNFNQLN